MPLVRLFSLQSPSSTCILSPLHLLGNCLGFTIVFAEYICSMFINVAFVLLLILFLDWSYAQMRLILVVAVWQILSSDVTFFVPYDLLSIIFRSNSWPSYYYIEWLENLFPGLQDCNDQNTHLDSISYVGDR